MSVVVPCYNYEAFLPAAVRSALDQPGVEVDVIVVDDCSTDGSLEVASDLAAKDPRITVLANTVNSGPVATFNRGLELARGEHLVRLDADDLLTPDSLIRAVALLQACPSVGLVYGRPVHFEGTAVPPAQTTPTGWLVWSGLDWLRARCMDGTNVITSPEVVMRRAVVDMVGGQRPLAHTHDMEMWLRIAAHSDIGYIQGADQAWHREHGASLSNQASDPRVILSEIRDAFDVLFEGLEPLDADLQEMRVQARRAVALTAVGYARNRVDRGEVSLVSQDLQEFAHRSDRSIVDTSAWRALERATRAAARQPHILTRMRGLPSRARSRLRHDARWRRWQRTGVYEPLKVAGGRGLRWI